MERELTNYDFSSVFSIKIHIKNAAAGFVFNRYSTKEDVIKLGWLPISELLQLEVLKSVHKSLHNPNWPKYLALDRQLRSRQLRSSTAPRLVVPMETGTFQDSAENLFNALPADIRAETNL